MSQKASAASKKKNINHPNEFVLRFPRPPSAEDRGDARVDGIFSLVRLATAGPGRRHAQGERVAGSVKQEVVLTILDSCLFPRGVPGEVRRTAWELADWRDDLDRSGHGRCGSGRWRAVRTAEAGRNLPQGEEQAAIRADTACQCPR